MARSRRTAAPLRSGGPRLDCLATDCLAGDRPASDRPGGVAFAAVSRGYLPIDIHAIKGREGDFVVPRR